MGSAASAEAASAAPIQGRAHRAKARSLPDAHHSSTAANNMGGITAS